MRHGMEKGPTPHEEEERRFLARASKAVSRAGEEGLFDELVIFAPPRALGTIRAELPYVTREKIAASDQVDVVRETADQIGARLRHLRLP
jgi:protein required for attachment to host cells